MRFIQLHWLSFIVQILCQPSAGILSWTDSLAQDQPLTNPCVVADPSTNTIYEIGGELQTGVALASWRSYRVVRSGNTVAISVLKPRTPVRIDWGFGALPTLTGFSCRTGTSVHFYNGQVFIVGANDLRSNEPTCRRCDLRINICWVLPCRNSYDSCAVRRGKYLYQIGGNAGLQISNSISCIDMDSGLACNALGNLLVEGEYNAECFMTDTGIVAVVGGHTSSKRYSDTIQLCDLDAKTCRRAVRTLSRPAEHARVLPHQTDGCLMYYFGGADANFYTSDTLELYDACTDTTVSVVQLGQTYARYSFGVAKLNGVLCFVGGYDYNENLIGRIDCQPFGPAPPPTTTLSPTKTPTFRPTPRPTTKEPTQYPTLRPTLTPTMQAPTARPTLSPTTSPTVLKTDPGYLGNWTNRQNFSREISSPLCTVNEETDQLYVYGGWHESGATTDNRLKMIDSLDLGIQLDLPVMESGSVLKGLHCDHRCAFAYGDKLFLVAPQHSPAQNLPQFYACNVTNTSINCESLCFGNSARISCVGFQFSPCVVRYEHYLVIAGGFMGISVSDEILVFDMNAMNWRSREFIAHNRQLAYAVNSGACSVWNDSLYIFGGGTLHGTASNMIQRCPLRENAGCEILPTKIPEKIAYGFGNTIGSSVVVSCYRTIATDSHSRPLVYELMSNTFRPPSQVGEFFGGTGRQHCCVAESKLNHKLIMVGGTMATGFVKTPGIFGGIDEAPTEPVVVFEECLKIRIVVPRPYTFFNTMYFQFFVASRNYQKLAWKGIDPTNGNIMWLLWNGARNQFQLWSRHGSLFGSELKKRGTWVYYDHRLRVDTDSVMVQLVCEADEAIVNVDNLTSGPSTWTIVEIVIAALGVLVAVCIGVCAGRWYTKWQYTFRIPKNALPDESSSESCCCGSRKIIVRTQSSSVLPRGVVADKSQEHGEMSSTLEVDPSEVQYFTAELKQEIEESYQKEAIENSRSVPSKIKIGEEDLFPRRGSNSTNSTLSPPRMQRRGPARTGRLKPAREMDRSEEPGVLPTTSNTTSPKLSPFHSPITTPGASPVVGEQYKARPDWGTAAEEQELRARDEFGSNSSDVRAMDK